MILLWAGVISVYGVQIKSVQNGRKKSRGKGKQIRKKSEEGKK